MLYELLTGERLFRGSETAETLAQVLTKEPPWERVPPQVRRLLQRCLEKDPKRRLRDIGEARYLVEESGTEVPRSVETRRLRHLWPAVAAVLAMISAALGWMAWQHLREEPPRVTKLFFPCLTKRSNRAALLQLQSRRTGGALQFRA